MGLLAAFRRTWFLIAIGLLALPMLREMTQPAQTVSQSEARKLAPVPQWPRTVADWRWLPVALDSYLRDHFGFRDELTRLQGLSRLWIGMPNRFDIVIGRDGHLFYALDDAIEQSMGRLMRRAAIARSADRLAELEQRVRARGTQLIVAMPPNASTIGRALLPEWIGRPSAPTEYDVMLVALAARGVRAVDLRPALFAAMRVHPVYYKTDTHWNQLGGLIGYNTVVAALGRPEWGVAQERVVKGFELVAGGDVARALNAARDLPEEEARIDLSSYAPAPERRRVIDAQRAEGGFVIDMPHAGPTVVVIGDSFTAGFWPDYFALHAARYAWLPYRRCGFSDEIVQSLNPDIVILAPTERLMLCATPSAP